MEPQHLCSASSMWGDPQRGSAYPGVLQGRGVVWENRDPRAGCCALDIAPLLPRVSVERKVGLEDKFVLWQFFQIHAFKKYDKVDAKCILWQTLCMDFNFFFVPI